MSDEFEEREAPPLGSKRKGTTNSKLHVDCSNAPKGDVLMFFDRKSHAPAYFRCILPHPKPYPPNVKLRNTHEPALVPVGQGYSSLRAHARTWHGITLGKV